MVQPVEHDFGSAASTTAAGAAWGAIKYGLIGTLAATAVGAVVAGAGGLAVTGALGLVGFGATKLLEAAGAVSIGSAADFAAFAFSAAPMVSGITAAIGGIMGFSYGGMASLAGGAIAGAVEGQSQVSQEQGLAQAIQYEKAQAQNQTLAAARGDAIEQGAMLGYMQAQQDIAAQQSRIVKQILESRNAQGGAQVASFAQKEQERSSMEQFHHSKA